MSIKQSPQLDIQWLEPEAVRIVQDLQRRGFTAYLVGGCVRDILLGKHPKDFDIATNASPQEVKRAIRNCFIIGKRFRLVLAKRGDLQFEVATFRREPRPDENLEELPEGDNLFGRPEEDARRRDFTINSLFYDPVKNKLIDYEGGLKDLKSGVIRMIGDPNIRLVEDPIRIMRGIRLSHMIRFRMEPQLKKAISKHAETLSRTALPRRREEFLKYLRLEDPSQPIITSLDLGALPYITPTLMELFKGSQTSEDFLRSLTQIHEFNPGSPGELFGHFLLSYVRAKISPDPLSEVKTYDVLKNKELDELMKNQLGMFKSEQTLFAKALHMEALLAKRKIFEKRGARRQAAILANPSFPLALQFAEKELLLSPEDIQYWKESHTKFLETAPERKPRSAYKKRPRRKKKTT